MSDQESKVPLPNLDGDVSVSAALPEVPLADEVDTNRSAADLEAVFDVPVQVSAVLGRARMDVGELLRLGPAPFSSSTARSASRSTFTSTIGWSRAAKSSWSRRSSA